MAVNLTAVILVSFIFLVAIFFRYRLSRKLKGLEGRPAPELTGDVGEVIRSGKKALFFSTSAMVKNA